MFEWGNKKNQGEESTYPQRGTLRDSLSAKVLSYRNRSIDLKSKSIDWFIYDGAFIV